MEHLPLEPLGETDGAPVSSQPSLYESDFYQWIQQTAGAIKAKAFDQVDWDNVIEKIESIGRSERRELKSRLIVLLEHLLKLHHWTSERALNERAGATLSSSNGDRFTWCWTIAPAYGRCSMTFTSMPITKPAKTFFSKPSYRNVLLKAQLPEGAIPHDLFYGMTKTLASKSLLA